MANEASVEVQITKLKLLNKSLRTKNAILKETLRVIQSGEVDALVVAGPTGDRIFTLQSDEQPYRELVEAMNEGAITVSPDGIILYCNARFESMTKVPHEKLVGSDFRSHICPESRKALKSLLERSRSTPSSAEISLHAKDQTLLPVQLSVSGIELVGAEGFCIIATDLSAQKESVLVLQQQEWLGTLLNLLPVPLVLLRADLKEFTFVNAKADEILGQFNRRNFTQFQNLLTFEDEKGRAIEISDLLMSIDGGARSIGAETILVTKERKIPILLFSETLHAMHGREPVKLLMFQDISTIKQAQLDLAVALRGRDQFMAALSHELRTPLNVILGWVQLLRANSTDQKMVTQALDTLERNADLQRDLIEDLLDMSRIITGNLALQLKPLDLKSYVRDCLTSLQLKAKEKSIVLQIDLLPEPAIVSADGKRIQQLISNIVQNAIKFTPPNGKIIVSVRTDKLQKKASIRIQDSGQGIDPTFLPHVFDQFKQENMTTNRSYGGLGLGLAICKTIVEQHNGEIKAVSEGRGKGATFIVQLPLFEQVGKPIVPIAVQSEEKFNLSGLRILVIDDSTDNLALFSIWLKKSGADVKTLGSAFGVVEAIEMYKPHVLLSDISMPGEDGFALIAKVRALAADKGGGIPAGAITANARIEDMDQTLAAGFHLHISKPVTSSALLKAVSTLANIGREHWL